MTRAAWTVWESHHPGTGRVSEHDTLARAVWWFAGESLEWLALRWFVPVLVAGAIVGGVAIRLRWRARA